MYRSRCSYTNDRNFYLSALDYGNGDRIQYTYDAWGNPLTCTGTLADTLGAINPLRYRGYVYDTETGLYYLQSRYYNPETGRFLNADGYTSTGQGFLGNNMFAYCNNCPVNFADPTGQYMDYWDYVNGGGGGYGSGIYGTGSAGVYGNIGGSAVGVSAGGGAGGGTGGTPIPVNISIFELVDVIETAVDLADGFGTLSQARKYGIMGYSSLRKEIAKSGLEAHHIVEVRILKKNGIDPKTAPSVALTPAEHRMFTNSWRKQVPYGSDYEKLGRAGALEVAEVIYKDYPELLKAAKMLLN